MSLMLVYAKSEIIDELKERIRYAELKQAGITGEIRALNEILEFIEGIETTADMAFEYDRKHSNKVTD